MQQIGRYQVLAEVGRGAMGVVYRAQDPTIGRVVAIKAIRLTGLSDGTEGQRLRDRLYREAQSAGVLSHPHIVTIYDILTEGENAYIFMEFVDGPTLEQLVAAPEPPDPELLLSLLRQTAEALDYAHRRGVIHRDIKPANIMVHEGISAKITDFGVAKLQSQQLTQAGMMMGTPNYMAPEQVDGKAVDGRADQFSLGVIAYELLTGERPFVAETIPTLLYKIAREEPVAPQSLNPSLGDQVEPVVRRALSKDPEHRFPSCSAFISALAIACQDRRPWEPVPVGAEQALPTVGEASAPLAWPEELAPVKPQPRRQRGMLAAALVFCFLLGAGVAYWKGRPEAAVPVDEQPVAATNIAPPTAVPQEKPSPIKESPSVTPDPTADKAENEPPGAAPEPAGTADRTETFQIVTSPTGARVTLDDTPTNVCTAPCTLRLPAGRHTMAARLDGFRTALRVVNLPGTNEVLLQLDPLIGKVLVKSVPDGASITVDGKPRPERTPSLLSLPVGTHRIEIAKEGLPRVTEVLTVRDGALSTFEATLQ